MNRVLWPVTTLAVALALVGGVAQVAGASKPATSPPRVAGSYTYVSPGGSANPTQSVILQAAGSPSATGTFSWTMAATHRYLAGSVTCVQVDVQDAWVAGSVRKSDPADASSKGVLFRIHGDDAAPLMFTVATFGEPTAALATADCTAMDRSLDSYLAPMLAGTMTVRPAGLTVYSLDASFSAMSQLASLTAAGTGMVGVVLPDPALGSQIVGFDVPYLTTAFTAAGYPKRQFRIDTASGASSELALAQADIAAGATVVVALPPDRATGESIHAAAAAANVPYVSLSNPTFHGTNAYYVGFDNVRIGRLIGWRFEHCVTNWGVADARVFQLDGDENNDPNAIDFAKGYNSVIWGTEATPLTPPLSNGLGYTLVGDEMVPHWDPNQAQQMFQTAYSADPSINATLEANDWLANAVINVLKASGVGPRTIPTTGQDAVLPGMADILEGYLCGSIYKPIYLEAQGAVALATYLRAGQVPPVGLLNGTITDPSNPAVTEPAVLVSPTWVTAANMESTVISDGWVSATDLCRAVGAAVCRAAGIH